MDTFVVRTANELKHIAEASFPEIFIASLENIYGHENVDIHATLNSRKPQTLKDLWNKLIPVLQDRHDLCKNMSPLACKTKKTEIIPEILLICRFLTTPSKDKPQIDLDSFFSPSVEQPIDLTVQEELIKFVKLLKSEVDTLKSEALC